tara:strand:+ start:408 stop:716 length:309 start_codon:yes stop_codon:yes gene_type:complete
MHDVEHAYQMGYTDGFRDAQRTFAPMSLSPMQGMQGFAEPLRPSAMQPAPPAPAKRKPSAYNRRLGREIKALTARHKTKAGKWKKGWSQKRMMKAAHKAAKR